MLYNLLEELILWRWFVSLLLKLEWTKPDRNDFFRDQIEVITSLN